MTGTAISLKAAPDFVPFDLTTMFDDLDATLLDDGRLTYKGQTYTAETLPDVELVIADYQGDDLVTFARAAGWAVSVAKTSEL